MDPTRPVKVFLSYSQDSDAHCQRVRRLADLLRGDGIDIVLDQYEASPPQGWPAWMAEQIREADFVLVVTSKGYQSKATAAGPRGGGRGVKFESVLISQQLYNEGMWNERFIPVLLDQVSADLILEPLQPYTHYRLEVDYEKLYRRLTNQLQNKPPLGAVRALSTPDVLAEHRESREEVTGTPSRGKIHAGMITSTEHKLPFSELSEDQFEQLCFYLLAAEGHTEILPWGAAGNDGGCDIVSTDRDGRRWVTQVKRTQSLGPSKAVAELRKVLATPPDPEPEVYLLAAACSLSRTTTEKLEKEIKDQGKRWKVKCWALSVLDMKVRKHDNIMCRYFGKPGKPPDNTDARAAYLRWVIEHARYVALGGIDPAIDNGDDHRLHLDVVYTALLTRTPRRLEVEYLDDDPASRKAEPPLSALEQLNRHNRLVLLGDPGSGKSTFLAFVALCMAGELHPEENVADLKLLTSPLPNANGEDAKERQPWGHGAVLPVRVMLRDFAERGLPSGTGQATAVHLWRYIETELSEGQEGKFCGSLKKVLEKGEALVLLDGLDEVPEAKNRREQVCQAVTKFVETYSSNHFVVTSRTYAYQKKSFYLRNFSVAELAPFGRGQILRFVRRWDLEVAGLRELRPEEATGLAVSLENAIVESSSLLRLAERPLFLTFLASLHAFRGGSLPADRENLYDATVELLLEVWDRKRIRLDEEGFHEPRWMSWLKAKPHAVSSALKGQPELEGTTDVAAEKQVAKLSEILEERTDRVDTFPHRTFQEFLLARHLVDGSFDYPTIAGLVRREPHRWREVILLVAERLGSTGVWALTSHLAPEAGAEESENAWGLQLAGQVVVESANYEQASGGQQERLKDLRQRMPSLLASSQLPARERALAGAHLARLGDPRFDAELWSLPADDAAGFLEVPGGQYVLGTNEEDSEPSGLAEVQHTLAWEQPQITVELSPFWVSRWPVTVAQFEAFVKATGLEDYHPDALRDVANHPVVWLSWQEARKYCEWLTERLCEVAPDRAASAKDAATKKLWTGFASGALRAALPTEAQWEAAARGPDARLYPWGSAQPTAEHANFHEIFGGPTPVGTYPEGHGPFGAEDQAGNVSEWCADGWNEKAYEMRADQPIAVDPINTYRDDDHGVWRGGSWSSKAPDLRTATRRMNWRLHRCGNLGFRVFGVLAPSTVDH